MICVCVPGWALADTAASRHFSRWALAVTAASRFSCCALPCLALPGRRLRAFRAYCRLVIRPACMPGCLLFHVRSEHPGQPVPTGCHTVMLCCRLRPRLACIACLLACLACCLAVLPVFIIRHSRAMMLGGGILPPHSGSTGQSVIISSSVCSCYYSAIAALDCNCEGLESAASHFYWQPPVSQWWSHADASHTLTHDSCHAVAGSAASVGS
jgi:hypothetical protein